MVTNTNPFTPGFGLTPPALVTRGKPIEDFENALEGHWKGRRNVLIAGARGTGKTVLLTQFQLVAEDLGWEPITLHTGSSSLTGELRSRAIALLEGLDPDATSSRLTSGRVHVAGAGGAVQREVVDRYADEHPDLGVLLERLATLVDRTGGGLLIQLDEVQSADRHQLYEVAQHVQDLTRNDHAVSFVAAGIRAGVDALLAHEKTTFLRRAHQVPLSSVDVGSAAEAIALSVSGTDRRIGPEAAVAAGEISQGYPYLIQLIGAEAWDRAGDAEEIALEDVRSAELPAVARMVRDVHDPALRDLAPRKMDYLVAMLEDDGPSSVSAIAERLDVDLGYQGVYRDRLIRDELIRPAGTGLVTYALPYLRQALLERRQGPGPLAEHLGARVTRPRTRRPRRPR